jgi:hypothetical protein
MHSNTLTKVDHQPANQSRPQLAELLQVQVADSGVQLAADEVVVDGAARVAALSEQLALGDERRQVPLHDKNAD